MQRDLILNSLGKTARQLERPFQAGGTRHLLSPDIEVRPVVWTGSKFTQTAEQVGTCTAARTNQQGCSPARQKQPRERLRSALVASVALRPKGR